MCDTTKTCVQSEILRINHENRTASDKTGGKRKRMKDSQSIFWSLASVSKQILCLLSPTQQRSKCKSISTIHSPNLLLLLSSKVNSLQRLNLCSNYQRHSQHETVGSHYRHLWIGCSPFHSPNTKTINGTFIVFGHL